MQVLFILRLLTTLSRLFSHHFFILPRLIEFMDIKLNIVYRRPCSAIAFGVFVETPAGVSENFDVIARFHARTFDFYYLLFYVIIKCEPNLGM